MLSDRLETAMAVKNNTFSHFQIDFRSTWKGNMQSCIVKRTIFWTCSDHMDTISDPSERARTTIVCKLIPFGDFSDFQDVGYLKFLKEMTWTWNPLARRLGRTRFRILVGPSLQRPWVLRPFVRIIQRDATCILAPMWSIFRVHGPQKFQLE